MIINELHIAAFGGLVDREIILDRGLNIIEGANESGKTSAAMFIKFIFYGLSGKSTGGAISERKRYVNFTKSMASGYLLCTVDGVKYRIERTLLVHGDGEGSVRETVRIVNLNDGSITNGACPGEFFFGVNESMFVNTVFVGQLASIRPDGEGLGGAVENMLSAADENINLKKAAEKLNAARREIQHKNGNGGEIAALREERESLANEVQDSAVSSEELIVTEASLVEAVEKKAQLEQKKEKFDGIFRALDAILLQKKLDAVSHTEEKIEKIREQAAKIDQSGFLERYGEALDGAERDIRAYREASADHDDSDVFTPAVQAAPSAVDPSIANEVLDEADYLDSKGRVQFAVAVAMVIAAVLGLAATALLYHFNTGSYLLPLLLTGVCAVLGIVFFVLQHRTVKHLYELLDEWNAWTMEDLERILGASAPAETEEFASVEEAEQYAKTMEELRDNSGRGEVLINSMAERIGVECQDDPLDTAAAIRDYGEKLREERDNLKARAENFAGRLSVLKEQVAHVDAEKAERDAAEVLATPYGKLALSLDAEGIRKAIRERDFTNGAYKSQSQRVEELERTLAELKQRAKSPAEAAARIAEIDETIRELELKRDGYNLAVEALKKAGENVRCGVVPKLAADASEIMGCVADGKYTSLMPDSDFGMNYMSGTETRSVEYMSKGTYDAAYIALRLALMRVVYQNVVPPVVMDESFAYIDETRFVNLLGCISRAPGQSIFFTCRERETVEANRASLRYNLIRM